MTGKDLSKNLWAISNLLTGFSAVQGLTFVYTCTKPEFANLINRFLVKMNIAIFILIITLLECIGVWWCDKKAITLMELEDRSNDDEKSNSAIKKCIIKQVTLGRIIIIVFLLITAILSLYARQLGGVAFNGRP